MTDATIPVNGATLPNSKEQSPGKEEKALKYAKQGLWLAIFAGMAWSWQGLFADQGSSRGFYADERFWLLSPILCGAINDTWAGVLVTIYNLKLGRGPELVRSLASKPGRFVMLGAMFGSIIGMSFYMASFSLVGAAYTLPITASYPALAAFLAIFILRERIRPLGWLGLAGCVIGAIIIGYEPPETITVSSGLFYLGLFLALVAAFGWAMEGVLATFAMDFVQPAVALNIYHIAGATVYCLVLIPLICSGWFVDQGGFTVVWEMLSGDGTGYLLLAGTVTPLALLSWYKSMNMTGVSRAMAINVTYSLWGIIFTAIFWQDVELTTYLIVGAVVMFIGTVLVIGNPRDLMNLRKLD